jgi:ABC-type antimicrobial peptide transport system permease subunit
MIRNLKDTLLTRYATIQIQPANADQVLSKLEGIWPSIAGDKPLETEFVSDKIEGNYRPFFNMMNIFSITGISIVVIALLGQFGIALYATQSRTKEIGIRKVLGANIHSIIALLSKGSFKTLTITTLIALPLVYLVFREMIFPTIAIKLEISTPHLLLTVIGTWAIVLGIVAHQSWRTGQVNPTESLRNE